MLECLEHCTIEALARFEVAGAKMHVIDEPATPWRGLPCELCQGGTGDAADEPTTVFHCFTRQRLTRPCRTYGSASAKAVATSGESPSKRRKACSVGSSSAPASSRPPASAAFQ